MKTYAFLFSTPTTPGGNTPTPGRRGRYVSVYGVNINVGAVLELAPGSELAINHTTVDGSGHTVISSGLMINQGTMILDSGSAFEVKSLESGMCSRLHRMERDRHVGHA